MMQSHASPIPPSPARLGITATSPSLPPNPIPNSTPNPNPNPKQAPPSSSSSSAAGQYTAATSSALLSLLPPLPRAQAILPQMAALASKLFDLSPHRSVWLAAYRGNPPNFSKELNSSAAATTGPVPASTKDLISLFTTLQTQLFEAVAELQEILDLQDARVKVAREVRAKDSALLSFTKKIREAEQVLDHLIDDYSNYRRDPKRPRIEQDGESNYSMSLHSSLDLEEILSYAHRISYTTFAPPEHGAGLAPLRGALPPAPQDNEMRASQLYHFADLDVGLPKKAAPEAKERATADAVTEILLQPTPPREDVPVAMLPPLLPIAVPPGWRKGMPVELPSELPPVPPGWKPGDPVTLPLDGVMVGNKGDEQQMPGVPGVLVGQPKAPEAIQVKYVQLDINPDQDDYSSDYSSEVGSSEEDED
ncbi:Vitamin-D-receptor interacting Mediator subunit 4 [Musa troglodytarum]|uniref:Mediator of RNA polymerase II transcription subunit 4 n=1 Tax=Musa troglodytarum TaxID=320322 RepID=A0A9E7GNJ8_9LILI|nr:Vitamin-D-receptor interacting Mediator subunit 4 [Musa troglodytarum]URE20217.1 Vitamin-D-receptor interacting Mediator subunit 4 [Musa troglodytarum]